MYNGLKYLFIFTVGAAAGAVVTHQILKPKYERMVQEEVNEFKNDWAERNNESEEETDSEVTEDTVPDEIDLAAYKKLVDDAKYASILEEGGSKSMSNDDPYVISPLKFAEGCDYETISLTYFKNGGILVDELGELVNDIEGTVGLEFHEHFGEYTDDPDTVYVRNDRLEVDYEIQLDIGEYTANKNLNPMDDE